jgi:F0F1-type ATP synthase assembly protein I
VTEPPRKPHPIALAMEWVAKITTVSLEMFLPAVAGGYVDRRFGTNYWALIGVVVGMTVGLWHLLQMTKVKPKADGKRDKSQRAEDESDDEGMTGGRPGK